MMFHSSRFPDLIRMALHSVCDARHRSPYAREHHCLTAVRANRHEKQQPEIQQQQKIYRIQVATYYTLFSCHSGNLRDCVFFFHPASSSHHNTNGIAKCRGAEQKKNIARRATRDFNSDNFFSAASSSFLPLSLSVPLLYNCQIVAFVCIPQILRYSGGCCRPTFSGILLHSQTN